MTRNFVEEATSIIRNNLYLTLGTTDGKSAWVSPLYYAYDDKLDFCWVSPKNSVHAQNTKIIPQISFVIFDSHSPKWTGIGLYIAANCREITDQNLAEYGLRLEFERLQDPTPPIVDFLGDNEYRVYKSTPTNIWITADKEVDGKTIDYRELLNIQELRRSLELVR